MPENTIQATTDEKIHEIFKTISKALDVPVELIAEGEDNKVVPYFDVNAITSKYFALLVYIGANVPATPPPYNRVHADVEFWKNKLQPAS